MNKGIFLAGLGIFIYCVTNSAIDLTYFVLEAPLLLGAY
jgi:hypothetical protein